MLTFKWSFICDGNQKNALDIEKILRGECEDVARFACTKSSTPGFGYMTSALRSGYMETRFECTETLCRSIISMAKWTPMSEQFGIADADKYFQDPGYEKYISPVIPEPPSANQFYINDWTSNSEPNEFGASTNDLQMDIVFEDSVDFASLDASSDTSAQSSNVEANLGDMSVQVLSLRDSFYHATRIAEWSASFTPVYSAFLSSREGIAGVEDRLQNAIPAAYPRATSPLEFRRYHLQLSMFRGNFDQLFGQYVSFFLYQHPSSAWHQKCPTDEILMQHFASVPSVDEIVYSDLESLRLESQHADYANFVLNHIVFCQPGGTIQPFARIWRSMIGMDYEPGDRPRDFMSPMQKPQDSEPFAKATSIWDTPIKTATYPSQMASSFDHLMRWTVDSNAWFKVALETPWKLVGSVSKCFADIGELLSMSILKINTPEKHLLVAESNASKGLSFSKSLGKVRSQHINQRCLHLLAATCHVLSHLNEIVSCAKVSPLVPKWMISTLFNMTHLHELLEASITFTGHVKILSNLYDKANSTMMLLQLWRFCMLLPTILGLAFGPKVTQSLLTEAKSIQTAAKALVHDDTRSENEWRPGHAMPRVMVADNRLKQHVCNWLILLCKFAPHLIARIYFYEKNRFLHLGKHYHLLSSYSNEQDYVAVSMAANVALLEIEEFAPIVQSNTLSS